MILFELETIFKRLKDWNSNAEISGILWIKREIFWSGVRKKGNFRLPLKLCFIDNILPACKVGSNQGKARLSLPPICQ